MQCTGRPCSRAKTRAKTTHGQLVAPSIYPGAVSRIPESFTGSVGSTLWSIVNNPELQSTQDRVAVSCYTSDVHSMPNVPTYAEQEVSDVKRINMCIPVHIYIRATACIEPAGARQTAESASEHKKKQQSDVYWIAPQGIVQDPDVVRRSFLLGTQSDKCAEMVTLQVFLTTTHGNA